MLCDTWRQQMQCDSQPAHCTNGGFPQMLPSMANLLQQVVCVCTEGMYFKDDQLERIALQVLKFCGWILATLWYTYVNVLLVHYYWIVPTTSEALNIWCDEIFCPLLIEVCVISCHIAVVLISWLILKSGCHSFASALPTGDKCLITCQLKSQRKFFNYESVRHINLLADFNFKAMNAR